MKTYFSYDLGHAVPHSTRIHDPRDSMAVLWRYLQPFLTLLTGKPLPGERPWLVTPWRHLGLALCSYLCGILVALWILKSGSTTLLLLPISWLLTVHGARKLRTVIMHQCSHDNFIRNKKFDRRLGKIISIGLVAEEFDSYRKPHNSDHHSRKHLISKRFQPTPKKPSFRQGSGNPEPGKVANLPSMDAGYRHPCRYDVLLKHLYNQEKTSDH